MNTPDDESRVPIDDLVARHLSQQTARVDARRLHARVHQDFLSGPAGFTPRHSIAVRARRVIQSLSWRNGALSVATVLGLMAAFLGGRYFATSAASAATILRDVRAAHCQNIDRCYRVQFTPDAAYWDGRNPLKGPSESILWTRGDRFWADVQIGRVQLVVGRNEQGALWAAPQRSKGILFADDLAEMPEEVAFACRVNAMSLTSLVEDVLADFDLRSEGPSFHGGTPTNLVWANLKSGRSHRLLSAALLEIDAATDVIVRLVLWTIEAGEPKGTITLTLIDSGFRSDAEYRLESHLDPDAVIERRDLRPKPAAAAATL